MLQFCGIMWKLATITENSNNNNLCNKVQAKQVICYKYEPSDKIKKGHNPRLRQKIDMI